MMVIEMTMMVLVVSFIGGEFFCWTLRSQLIVLTEGGVSVWSPADLPASPLTGQVEPGVCFV